MRKGADAFVFGRQPGGKGMKQLSRARPVRMTKRRIAAPRRATPRLGVRTVTTIATALLHYLAQRFQVRGLRYRAGLTPAADGWETFVFHLQLRASSTLPSELSGPLTIRLRNGSQGIPRGQREYAILRRLHQ